MSGYRQSGFDPNAFEQPGPPLRPFNWVQWAGVVLAIAGLAINLAYFAGHFGWMPPLLDGTSPALVLLIVGVVLINSRRRWGPDAGEEQRRANRRWLIIILGLCAIILGVAAAIDFSGAN